MNATEKAVAYEWRACISSFIKHSECQQFNPTYRYAPRLLVQQQLAASANLSAPTGTGMELVPTNEWDRLALWNTEKVIEVTKQ
ncbi:hypothetical protein JCM10296v2_004040 [Rhodotorula toruloides]